MKSLHKAWLVARNRAPGLVREIGEWRRGERRKTRERGKSGERGEQGKKGKRWDRRGRREKTSLLTKSQ